MLTTKELMCIYFGFVSGKDDVTEVEAKKALKITSEILGMPEDEYRILEKEALDGLEKVNGIMNKMLELANQGKDPFEKQGGDEEWR